MSDIAYDWGNVTKAELREMDASGNPRKPVQPGTYQATVVDIRVGKSKGGAFGVYFTYSINGGPENGRRVQEGVFLVGKNGQVLGFGGGKLKRRMLTLGLSPEQIQNFKFPKSEKNLGDFKLLLDAEVIIETTLETIQEGELAGVAVARVAKVFPRMAEKQP